MVAEQLIHSGSFSGYNDDTTISVYFYKRIDISSSTTSISVDNSRHNYIIDIWSKDGEAYVKSSPNWVTYGLYDTVEMTGYTKYVYKLTIDYNSGSERTGTIVIGVVGNDWAELEIPITQEGA